MASCPEIRSVTLGHVEELYREQILEHYKRPMNFGVIDDPDLEFEDTNPFCGDEQHVTIKATKRRIVIEPSKTLDFKLEDLVAGITRQNVHGEVDFGGSVGREAL